MTVKVVLAHGVFDLLHAGHLEHLKQAKAMGDYLIVSVVDDKYASKGKPIYSQKERLALLWSLRCVDHAMLCGAPGPEKVIREWEPDLYVRGSDYRGKTMPESALLARLGIPVRYTRSVPPRTGEIISRIRHGSENG